MPVQKKILLIASEFPPEPGGIGNHAFHLASSLQKRGFKIQVITDQRIEDIQQEKTFDASYEFFVERVRITRFRSFMYLTRIVAVLKHILKNEIIIASGKFSLWSVAFSSFLFKNKKYIAVIHGTEVNLQNPFLKGLTNFSLQRFKKIIAVSNFTKSFVNKEVQVPIEVIPNGFEIEDDKVDVFSYSDKGYPKLITVGNVTKRKGQLNVIKALPVLIKSYPSIKYRIVGTPTEKKLFLEVARQLNVEKNIIFYGIVSQNKKQQLLKTSDIFVMLSENLKNGDVEGFGIALLEANALGIPSIGASKCGIEDAIDNYSSGIVVDNNNPKAIKNAVQTILNSYPDYSNNAISWSHNFTWDKIINQYIKILNS